MKRITICSLLILLSTAIIYAEVARKRIIGTDGNVTGYVFYSEGEEIANQMIDDNGNIIKTTGKIPDGIVRQHYKSGELWFECNYKDNKQEGISKIYYENGNLMLMSELYYKDGKAEGISKVYYESGELKSRWNFKNGKLEGIGKDYYKSGKLMAEWNFKNDKLEGISKMYYENGKLMEEQNFKNGKREGINKVHYKNGEIHYTDTYKNGQRIKRKAYDESGKLKFEKDYPIEKKGEK